MKQRIVRLLLLPGLLAPIAAASDGLSIRARDSATGATLAARVTLQDGSGLVRVHASHMGYRSLETHFTQTEERMIPVTLWLDPIAPRERPAIPDGEGVIEGWLYDEGTGDPIEGALVLLNDGSLSTASDASGYFRLAYESPDPDPEGRPALGRLTVSAPGYQLRLIDGVVLSGGFARFIEDLGPGAGESLVDIAPMPLLAPSRHQDHQSAPQRPDAPPLGPPALPDSPLASNLQAMTPPSTIRVGTGCSCTSCSGVSVMSLETYAASGLDNEWISSWSAHSLRSGAIPYRAYGSWYVYNPISGSYDICSTTCCQVWGSTTYGSTQSAANLTAGILLQRNTSIFRAEYSAENNSLLGTASCVNGDLSCGDGWAGSPAAGWPCLSDSVCAGQDCFGHGRGMCQWGTQRHAANQGRLWNWIANHYYNDGGGGSGSRTAYLTTPMTISWAAPTPSTVAPGDTFTIDVTAENVAGLDHSEIMIGASLYSAATGYIDDPPNDTKVYLSVGTNNESRPFAVPTSTPGGSYDLLVSLYYDVNGDSAITGSDQALTLQTLSGAVTVNSCGPISLSPSSLPSGTVGVAYSVTITASGGAAPYTFAVTAGALPPGLSLSTGGLLSGTPTTAGSYSFTVTATDSLDCQGSLGYTLSIASPLPTDDVLAGQGLGPPNPNRVRVLLPDGTTTLVDFLAYAAGRYGVNVAEGDIRNAGRSQILTGPGPGDVFGPQVRGFSRLGIPMSKVNYFAYATLRYGVNVDGGGVDADAYAEILTGPGPGTVFGPHVRGWNYDGTAIAALSKCSFFAYGTLRYGVNVASGGVDGDIYEEILTGPGPGAVFGPQVRGFDYDAASVASIGKINFTAFAANQYGAHVASDDVDADGYAEIAAAPGPGAGASFRSRFKGFDYDGSAVGALPGFDVTVGTTSYGGRVGLGDMNGDARGDLVAGLGRDPAAASTVSTFDYTGSALAPLASFAAFSGSTYGVTAVGGDLGF